MSPGRELGFASGRGYKTRSLSTVDTLPVAGAGLCAGSAHGLTTCPGWANVLHSSICKADSVHVMELAKDADAQYNVSLDIVLEILVVTSTAE